jgi:hypothetical protein
MKDDFRMGTGGRLAMLLCSRAATGRSSMLIAAVGWAPTADESGRGMRSAAPAMDRLPLVRDLSGLTASLPS